MGVSADAAYLDSAYKLVAFAGRPVLKLSAGKATLPGAKQVWRHSPIDTDVLAMREEPGPASSEALLVSVMLKGARVESPDTIEAARGRLARDLRGIPPVACNLHEPTSPDVVVSKRLRSLTDELTAGRARGESTARQV